MTSPTRALFKAAPTRSEAIEALQKHVATKPTDRLKRAEVHRIFKELMASIPKAEDARMSEQHIQYRRAGK